MTSEQAFSVDLTELDDFIRALTDLVAHVDDRMGELDAAVDALDASWSGDSASAHRDAHRRWIDGAREMRSALSELTGAAHRSHSVFVGVQDLHSRMWP